MSEPQTEDPTEPETPEEEPVSPQGPEPENPDAEPEEEIEGADEDGAETKQAEDGEANLSAVMDEKELEKRAQRLDAENTRHAKRIGEIMDEAAVDLVPCPVCMDGIAGWVYAPEAQALPEEAQLRLRQLIGLSGLEGLMQATFAQRCPACDGQGEVKTDSRVPGYETATCEMCSKMGWIRIGAQTTNGTVHVEPEPVMTGPTVFQNVEVDPEVRHLQERGFTVIPPFQPAQPA
jgi:hypothetical protein